MKYLRRPFYNLTKGEGFLPRMNQLVFVSIFKTVQYKRKQNNIEYKLPYLIINFQSYF